MEKTREEQLESARRQLAMARLNNWPGVEAKAEERIKSLENNN